MLSRCRGHVGGERDCGPLTTPFAPVLQALHVFMVFPVLEHAEVPDGLGRRVGALSTQSVEGGGVVVAATSSDARKNLDFTRECYVWLFHHLVHATNSCPAALPSNGLRRRRSLS